MLYLSRAVCCLLFSLVAVWAGEAEKLALDQWFVGQVNNQPAMTMHVVVWDHDNGEKTDRLETNIVLNRVLAGAPIAFEVRDTQVYRVNARGAITKFTFDHVENGAVTTAEGIVETDQVTATIHRLGRATDQTLKLPPNTPLMGQQAAQLLLADAIKRQETTVKFSTLAMMGNQIRLVNMTAKHQTTHADGSLTFGVTMDLLPVPSTMTIKPNGDLIAMSMDMGFLKIAFAPSDGPVPLIPAEVAPNGMVTAKGPAPESAPINRFRVPAAIEVISDEFQRFDNGLITVQAQAEPSKLAEPAVYLRAEPQLEIDDAQLKAWVDALVARHQVEKPVLAERLRLAVRGYIMKKDLSVGDGSALETFRSRTGDCTEHANLLAAVLRIAGIPSRVELGIVFAADFGGWVGHAWNSAYVGDRWVHVDSAYPGIPRSCYIKLGTTSGGDVQNTGAAMLTGFGKILGKEVETLPQE
jgi:Transglutaminase-like superfamily